MKLQLIVVVANEIPQWLVKNIWGANPVEKDF
jgi:hypothetical protein